MTDLFADERRTVPLAPGAILLGGFALAEAGELLAEIAGIAALAPFRQLETPGGRRMSVAMTNCGALGWVSDRRGYRYTVTDPRSGRPWPSLPPPFAALAAAAAASAGFAEFAPQACLINRYAPGGRLSLHQDRDEGAPDQPIVSVSLGVDATFLWGGTQRSEPTRRVRLRHGDVLVWGGPARFAFHGVAGIDDARHPETGALRYNLTFRAVASAR